MNQEPSNSRHARANPRPIPQIPGIARQMGVKAGLAPWGKIRWAGILFRLQSLIYAVGPREPAVSVRAAAPV